MEKDVEEVGKIAQFIKSKIEEFDKEVSKNNRIQTSTFFTFLVISYIFI